MANGLYFVNNYLTVKLLFTYLLICVLIVRL